VILEISSSSLYYYQTFSAVAQTPSSPRDYCLNPSSTNPLTMLRFVTYEEWVKGIIEGLYAEVSRREKKSVLDSQTSAKLREYFGNALREAHVSLLIMYTTRMSVLSTNRTLSALNMVSKRRCACNLFPESRVSTVRHSSVWRWSNFGPDPKVSTAPTSFIAQTRVAN